MLSRVAFEGTNVLKVSLVAAVAMLAICLLALVETKNTAQAEDSLPENGKIAFSHEGALYTVEPDGSNPRQLFNDTYELDRPVWSPDGTKIAFSHSRKGSRFSTISVMNADGSDLRHLHTIGIEGSAEPTWLPKGTKLAFNDRVPGGGPGLPRGLDIFVMDADGSNLTNVTGVGTEPHYDELWPDFSPDGKQMCVLRNTYTTNPAKGFYVMDADGSDPTPLVKLEDPDIFRAGYEQGGCNWSPDGTKIAFSLSPYSDVFVINADGRGLINRTSGSGFTRLTSNSAWDLNPAWSPDGKKIAFWSDRDGDFDIYTMDADGSDVAQVTNLPGDEYTPDWQPLTAKSRGETVHQPVTGGPSLILVASVLLLSGGVMFYAGLKRRV